MNNQMTEGSYPLEMDPYAVLEISSFASESEIQQSFHHKMKNAHNTEELIRAYGMIRDQAGRNRVRWDMLRSHLENPFKNQQENDYDLPLLIKELAFLSVWEMGEDACKN
jgi:hypothetical protein